MVSYTVATMLLGVVFLAAANVHAAFDANKIAPFDAATDQVQQVMVSTTDVIKNKPCGDGKVGTGICPNSDECCSQYGHCGLSKEFCGNGCVTGPCMHCGNGIIGSGQCANPTDCCSKEGYCGNTIQHCHPLHCKGGACGKPSTTVPCGNGVVGNGVCEGFVAMADPRKCCSKFGYCGRDEPGSTEMCGNGCLGGPCMSCGNGIRGNGVCPNATECCSVNGHCSVAECKKCDPYKPAQCYSKLTESGVRASGKVPYAVNVKPPYVGS